MACVSARTLFGKTARSGPCKWDTSWSLKRSHAVKLIITSDEAWDQLSSKHLNELVQVSRNQKGRIKAIINQNTFELFSSIIVVAWQSIEYYLEENNRSREAMRRKGPNLWAKCSWMLHQDNATTRTAMSIRNFLAKHSTNITSQVPYSPYLTPYCIFFCFLKLLLRVKSFETIYRSCKIDEDSEGI